MDKKPTPRKRGRPATGQIPQRIFRMDDESWATVNEAAELSGMTASEYIRTTVLKAATALRKKSAK